MLGFLRSLFPRSSAGVSAGVRAALQPVSVPSPTPLFNGIPIPTYPERGIAVPAAPPEALMASQKTIIDQLHQFSSFSRDDFNAYVMPAIRNYAAYVHLLPASESHHHFGQGGLFRHGLEVAVNACRACEGKMFGFEHWPSERAQLVPRWRMCALLGAMMHDMGKPILDVGALDETGKLVWNPHQQSLWEWLQRHSLKHYYIHWHPGARHKRHEPFTTPLLYRILPQETIDWISEFGGKEPFDSMIAALGKDTEGSGKNPLYKIFIDADSQSVDRDIRDSRARLAAGGMGGQRSLAMRMVRAIHDQILSGDWTPNQVGKPIYITDQGIFGLYPAVIEQTVDVLRAEGDKSLPLDYGKFMHVISDYGVIDENKVGGNTFSTFNLRIFADSRGKTIQIDSKAVRFSRDDILPKSMVLPAPVHADILDENKQPIRPTNVVPAPAPTIEQAAVPPKPGALPNNAPTVPKHVSAPRDLAPSMNDALLFGDGLEINPLIVSDDEDVPDLMTALNDDDPDLDVGVPIVRDRAKEPDVRDEMMRDAYATMNATFPPTTTKAAIEWFGSQGLEGALMKKIAKMLSTGDLSEREHVIEIRDQFHLLYPTCFEGMGTPAQEIREQLQEKGWTERDQATPLRQTVGIHVAGKQRNALRLTKGISQAFALMLPARNPDGSTTVIHKPVQYPRGPEIDAATNGLIRDGEKPLPEDTPIIRSAFYQFAVKEAQKKDRMPDALSGEDLRSTITQFARKHSFVLGYCEQHLTRQPNAVLIKAGTVISFNEAYRYDDDLAVVAAMSPTR